LCRVAPPKGRTGRRKPAAGLLAQAVRSIMTRSSGRLGNALMEEGTGTRELYDALVLLLGFVSCQEPCLCYCVCKWWLVRTDDARG
jgi:hypothetical protein